MSVSYHIKITNIKISYEYLAPIMLYYDAL